MRPLSRVRAQSAVGHSTFEKTPLDPYGSFLEICARDRAVDLGKKCHARLLINGFNHSIWISSKLISFYTQCGRISDARRVFDEMPSSNLGRWTILIGACSRRGFYQETLRLFSEMLGEGIKPNEYILPSVIRACANTSDLATGERLHSFVFRCWNGSDPFIGSALIDMYSKCSQTEKAHKVFSEMSQRDVAVWNAMISGYAQQGLVKDALGLFGFMRLEGIRPNLVTWNVLVSGFAHVGDAATALHLFGNMRDEGVNPDVVTWTSLISGFVKNFHNDDAFAMFRWMVASGVRPTSATISSLFSACATVADSKRGKEIHAHALVIGVEDDVFVSSSLVDMYAKCGFLFEARQLFSKMQEKNTVSWNSMIFGCANHGYCDEAIELFEKLVNEKEVKPDHLTFTAVFTACGHAGKVETGQNLFNSMQEDHGIQPRLEHYACMVDLLGRAGKLTEAYDLIRAMPIEPDSFVWGALLGACRNYGNVELAEIAGSHLFKLEPESAGCPVLLSNVFADSGRWEDAAQLKKLVKRRKLRRNPGQSWIEIH